MGLVVIIGPQAVGKMTVGQELEKLITYKLLFNHMTIDLLAPFLGYTPAMWELSSNIRLELFRRFVTNQDNPVDGIIFTVMIDFDCKEDKDFLTDIREIFEEKKQSVYFVELETDLETRLKRNVTDKRLREKPSKRDIDFSTKELLASVHKHRLKSFPGELETENYLLIDNTTLGPMDTAQVIYERFFRGGV